MKKTASLKNHIFSLLFHGTMGDERQKKYEKYKNIVSDTIPESLYSNFLLYFIFAHN